MATKKIELTPVLVQDQQKIKGLPAMKTIEAKWPTKDSSAAEARAAFKTWQDSVPEPKPPKNPEIAVRAVEPTTAALKKLTAVVNSEAAPAAMLGQQLDEKGLIGTVYSAVTTYQFMQMQSEFKTRSASARTRKEAETQWPDTVSAFQKSFAAAGLPGVSEEKLTQYARQLAASRENLEAVAKIVNSATAAEEVAAGAAPKGMIVAQAAKINIAGWITNIIPALCIPPITQGTFTKHLGGSFPLTVGLNVPCPTWKNPFKMCWKTYTIASVSYGFDLNVGYKVDCCGATAWGQAVAQACANFLGKTFCASCTGTVVAGVAVSKSPAAGGKCNYALGLIASLQCQFGGSTIFSASVPFGYSITGPCPPKWLNC